MTDPYWENDFPVEHHNSRKVFKKWIKKAKWRKKTDFVVLLVFFTTKFYQYVNDVDFCFFCHEKSNKFRSISLFFYRFKRILGEKSNKIFFTDSREIIIFSTSFAQHTIRRKEFFVIFSQKTGRSLSRNETQNLKKDKKMFSKWVYFHFFAISIWRQKIRKIKKLKLKKCFQDGNRDFQMIIILTFVFFVVDCIRKLNTEKYKN